MSLHDLPTFELAKRLQRVKHGDGDPAKVNQLLGACASRLAKLANMDEASVGDVPRENPEEALVTPPRRRSR